MAELSKTEMISCQDQAYFLFLISNKIDILAHQEAETGQRINLLFSLFLSLGQYFLKNQL